MFQPNSIPSSEAAAINNSDNHPQDLSSTMEMENKETSIVVRDEMQNGALLQAQSVMYHSQKLQDDLKLCGVKIKEHEGNIKLLSIEKNKLEESILDMQVILGRYHSSKQLDKKDGDHSLNQSEDEIIEKILHRESSAAGIFYQLKLRHGTQTSHLPLTKDVLGVVATLGKVDDGNLSGLLSEYLGVESMLAIVCKTFDGVKALETYDENGQIYNSGLCGLARSIGRDLDGRFLLICLENLRPYCGGFVADDPQRRLDLLKPKLPNGECPHGFIGFAVNMINVDAANLFYVTSNGCGLRETLFYSLFSRLQVYKTREDMLLALPLISEGAISLDGGMIKANGIFYQGNRNDVDVRFPKHSTMINLPEHYFETEKQLKDIQLRKEKLHEDVKREQSLLEAAKRNFEKKKEDFLKFLAGSSSYATQGMTAAAISFQ